MGTYPEDHVVPHTSNLGIKSFLNNNNNIDFCENFEKEDDTQIELLILAIMLQFD